MTTPTDSSWEAAGDDAEPETADAVEMYEDDGRVVLFDSENPLAWLEASRTVTVTDLV